MRTRDYSNIADIIRKLPKEREYRQKVAVLFAEELEKLKHNFNQEKFLVACGAITREVEEE